jgi:hypothetical protein
LHTLLRLVFVSLLLRSSRGSAACSRRPFALTSTAAVQ